MSNEYVLDSFAILTYLRQEAGWQRVHQLIVNASDAKAVLHMSIINMAEVQYIIIRRGQNTPQVLAALKTLPIQIAGADLYIPQMIALKAKYAVSMADCFCAALAISHNCPIITGDPEFKKMEDIITVDWL